MASPAMVARADLGIHSSLLQTRVELTTCTYTEALANDRRGNQKALASDETWSDLTGTNGQRAAEAVAEPWANTCGELSSQGALGGSPLMAETSRKSDSGKMKKWTSDVNVASECQLF